MREMSDMFKLVNQMELAKKARVGMSLTYFDVIELLGELNSLYEYIDVLEAERRWVPVSERLPEDLQPTVIITKGGMTGIVRYLELYGREGFGSWSEDVTHWMPLPNPPEVQE